MELNPLLLRLLQLTKQISPNLVLHVFNYDAAPVTATSSTAANLI